MIVSPLITAQLADQRERGFRAVAARRLHRRLARSQEIHAVPAGEIVIREAIPSDRRTLARLAAVDGKALPSGTVLLAEVEGEPQAALSVDDGVVFADPFRPTAGLVSLLAVRAHQLAA
jgi:hypothetical protein